MQLTDSITTCMFSDYDLTPRSAVKCYGTNKVMNGYIVDLTYSGDPYGFVVLDVSKPGFLSSCSIGKGILSPAAKINQTINKTHRLNSKQTSSPAHFVMASPLDFGIYDDESNNTLMLQNDQLTDSSSVVKMRSNKPDAWTDVMIRGDKIYGSGEYFLSYEHYVGDFDSLSESYAIEKTGHYACAVSALCILSSKLQIADMYLNPEIYMELWKATGTAPLPDDQQTKPGVIFGATSYGGIAPGFQLYAMNRGKVVTGQTVPRPSFEDFKQQVAADRNSIVSASLYGESLGHSMCAQGYAIATKKATGQVINTLAIADGWYDSVVYLSYSPSDYRITYGSFVYA